MLRIGPFELDAERRELTRDGRPVHLKPRPFELLVYLAERSGRLVSKEELLERLWAGRFVEEAVVKEAVRELRRALGDDVHEPRFIRTVHRRGYELVAPVARQGGEGAATAPRAEAPDEASLRQEVRFCRAPDGVRLAYATMGRGPTLVKAANWLSHLEHDWHAPIWRHWLGELARDHLLVRYDERGSGLSDWDVADLDLESWVRDLEAVVTAAAGDVFDLLGISQGGAVAIEYAVRHPERVRRLVLVGAYARGWARRPDQPAAAERRRALVTLTRLGWGDENPAFRQVWTTQFIPDGSLEDARSFNELQRVSTSAENAVRFLEEFGRIDVVELLPRVRVPTLVLHSRHDAAVPFEEGRRLAAGIPGARFVGLDSRNHLLLQTEPAWGVFLAGLRDFLAGGDDA